MLLEQQVHMLSNITPMDVVVVVHGPLVLRKDLFEKVETFVHVYF